MSQPLFVLHMIFFVLHSLFQIFGVFFSNWNTKYLEINPFCSLCIIEYLQGKASFVLSLLLIEYGICSFSHNIYLPIDTNIGSFAVCWSVNVHQLGCGYGISLPINHQNARTVLYALDYFLNNQTITYFHIPFLLDWQYEWLACIGEYVLCCHVRW